MTLLSALSARLIQIQLVDRKRYAESSAKAYLRIERIPAIRAMIVDRNDETIAKSIPVSSVYVDKNHLFDPKLAAYGLAYDRVSKEPNWEQLSPEDRMKRIRAMRGDILATEDPEGIVEKHMAYAIGLLARPVGMGRDEMRAKILDNKAKWFPIVKDMPDDIAERLRQIVDEHYIEGFVFENSIKRWYANPGIATHLTGFIGEVEELLENGQKTYRMEGKFGVESWLEEFLAGRDGRREHRRDARGLVVPGNSASLLPPRAGLNARLTIDIGMQAIVEEELDAGLAKYKSKRGAVIVMDPHTGEILAMASRPHFDLNHKENLAENSFNYGIQAKYEPGSTIKIIPVAAALEEGLVTLNTMIHCPSVLQEKNFTVRDSHSSGTLSVGQIIQKSNNPGCWKMAKQLGINRYYEYVHAFGFGERSGIMLSGENPGTAAIPKLPVDFSRSSYGYFIGVTPIQMAAAYSVIAGDGNLLRPRIVKALVANDGTVIEEFEREVRNKVISPETAQKMRSALHKVTLPGGTATKAAVPGFKVCGKTGTAVKHDPKRGGYIKGGYVVSFAGFMPADDPAFVCYVVVDEPMATEVPRYGGQIAAPMFANIAQRLATHMNLQPTELVSKNVANR